MKKIVAISVLVISFTLALFWVTEIYSWESVGKFFGSILLCYGFGWGIITLAKTE